MALFSPWWQCDTSIWGANSTWGGNSTQTQGGWYYVQPAAPLPKVLSVVEWRRKMLAATRTIDRPVNMIVHAPTPPARPAVVRRELQRAGPAGFARLGGRRPL